MYFKVSRDLELHHELYYSKDENRLFSDSASVGWAKTASRNTVYGTFPIIAISSADIISPPSMPRIAQPRIWEVSASTMAFIKPRASSTSSALDRKSTLNSSHANI